MNSQAAAAQPSFRAQLIAQFKNPSGCLGHLAGWIMAHRGSNVRRNLWTVALLNIQPEDTVLEIGYGPGVALAAAAERASAGHVYGLDHSSTMRSSASKRNRKPLREGRMTLLVGDAGDIARLLPAAAGAFDHIFAVNVAFFWADPVATLQALVNTLAPGGQLALTLQPRAQGATNDNSMKAAEAMQQSMRKAGLSDIEVHFFKEVEPWPACVIGRKPVSTGA